MNVSDLFKLMVEKQASDLFLRTMAYPRARIYGSVEIIHDKKLGREEMAGITNFLLENEQRRKEFYETWDVDFIHDEPEIGRFRINIFMQRGTPAIVARYVHSQVKSFDSLNLPVDLCEKVATESKGLFLVCGPAGNGKSTTIASILEYINTHQSKHIVTIEDPIEYLFVDNKSLINQRELGIDVPSYLSALKHVTQQSSDIIYIGNIRDVNTMRAAITATELGNFVMTTFHTINAVQTIIRVVNFFPPHQHDEVRMQLSLILRGTFSLRLVPCKDGEGRVPAMETMVVTPTIARLIRENRIREIQNFIDEGDMFGMLSFKKSLVGLVQTDQVDEDVARSFADSKDDFDLELKGLKRSI
ncbi:MAG: PilT/PilU family type 4a pilus ATPase [Candidatus Omnitrophica bacterium]|nr:PilT/PilU family type 4a pilus ATPase [Candidatus Omnitrophota bacterium]